MKATCEKLEEISWAANSLTVAMVEATIQLIVKTKRKKGVEDGEEWI